VSLHEDNVPLRNKGSGSKKLIAAAMQMKLHGGKNVSLIDEMEVGLEPHRIRGLIYKLKKSRQQIFTTTHSPVVLRELNVADNELYARQRARV
jgi:putative ATP-dependent endonuclease of the OLD family